MGSDNIRELSTQLISLGYRGESRRDLINSVPLSLLCDIIYQMLIDKIEDPSYKEQFIDDLVALTDGSMEERLRKREMAERAVQDEILGKQGGV